MSKILLERFICNRCDRTAEFILTKESIKDYDDKTTYDLWHYEPGLGHLCPECSKKLKFMIENFFK